MKFRQRHLRQLERFVHARVVPFALAVLVVWFGSNAFLASAAMSGTAHHHAKSECTEQTDSENSSSKSQLHEHCQFCFAPALTSGIPGKFSLSRLTVIESLKLEPRFQIVFKFFNHQLAAPRAPPVQTFSV